MKEMGYLVSNFISMHILHRQLMIIICSIYVDTTYLHDIAPCLALKHVQSKFDYIYLRFQRYVS